ncbi:hypothetical protein V6Z12_D11G070600 [Gossypium hirsutum]
MDPGALMLENYSAIHLEDAFDQKSDAQAIDQEESVELENSAAVDVVVATAATVQFGGDEAPAAAEVPTAVDAAEVPTAAAAEAPTDVDAAEAPTAAAAEAPIAAAADAPIAAAADAPTAAAADAPTAAASEAPTDAAAVVVPTAAAVQIEVPKHVPYAELNDGLSADG